MSQPAPKSPRERADFHPRATLYTGAALLGALLLIGGLLLWFQSSVVPPAAERTVRAAPAASPLTEAEFERGALRARLDAAAHARLSSYGWVDRGRGLVRIPLERALWLEARRRAKGARR
jgi:hypothetical protein